MGYTNLGTALITLLQRIGKTADKSMVILKSKKTKIYYLYETADVQVGKLVNEEKTVDFVIRLNYMEAWAVYKAINGLQEELDLHGGIKEDNKTGSMSGDNDSRVDDGPTGTENRGQGESGVLPEAKHPDSAAKRSRETSGEGKTEPAEREIGEQTQE